MPFGCWWFLNNPSIVQEITRERIEMLGTSFIPEHPDAHDVHRDVARLFRTNFEDQLIGRSSM